MKLNLLLTGITVFITSFAFSQFSIGTGAAIPISSYNKLESGAAKIGYQITANWDKSINNFYGISTGILLGGNPIEHDSQNFPIGQWRFSMVEVGAFIEPYENIKLKGLLSAGIYGTPEIEYINDSDLSGGRITLSKFSPGLDLRIEYSPAKYFIGINMLYSRPNIDFSEYNNNQVDIKSITNIGLLVGYIF